MIAWFAPLLNAIKAILLLQNPRSEPWLLFLTTLAKHEFIKPEVLTTFFKTIKDNCAEVAEFKDHLTAACGRCGVDLEPPRLASSDFSRSPSASGCS